MYNCVLVDDEKWVGVDLQKTVHWLDYGFNQPICFQDPHQAFEAICKIHPDVVFTDIRMPGMSGVDLIMAMRKHHIKSEIVILSAYEDFEAAQVALRLQVADYCLKPINSAQIETILETLTEKINTRALAGKEIGADKESYSDTIQRVVTYLEENIDKKLTLSDVAEVIYLNKNYLCSLFHEETGKSFSEYLMGLRISKAKELLHQTPMTIMEIADKLSFCDNYYFTKVFKKKVGVSPLEYRRSLKKSQA